MNDNIQLVGGGPWDGLDEPEGADEIGIPCGATVLKYHEKKIDGLTLEGKEALRRIREAGEKPVCWALYRLGWLNGNRRYVFQGFEKQRA